MKPSLNILKEEPVFWSRLGFCYDPPMKNAEGKPLVFTENLEVYGNEHRDFNKAGVKIHTCIVHSGWVGVDEYDYSLTDRVLDEVFRDNPDIYFIPRVKLNVPVDWCKENPEDVFVYYGGPETAEGVKELVGTLKQDYIGYEAPNGYYMAGDYVDTRPNVGGLIARQSFTSEKWLKDAKVVLEKFIDRLENSKYKDRILGYHIAYGASGECVLWGRASNRYGDYGISSKRAFYEWGIKKYGSKEKLEEAWCQKISTPESILLPTPAERYDVIDSIEGFFRKDNRIATDFDYFISDVNAYDIEYFGRIVKEKAPDKLAGAFYGYIIHVDNPAYTGHLAFEKLLNSPYIDFFAAPKSYYRNSAGEPGGVLAPTRSVNRKKIWVDELDNRTHLARNVEKEWTSLNIDTTRTVFWRELSKNISDDSGFWWMDLGGGWFDSPDIMETFGEMIAANKEVRRTEHKSQSDVLVLIDEECIAHMNISSHLRFGFMEDFLCELHMSGVLSDVYRLKDLEALDLTNYKLIIFAYTFAISERERAIINNLPSDKTLMFNYAAGVISDSGVSLDNNFALTGVKISPLASDKYNFPEAKVTDSSAEVFIKDDDGNARVVLKKRANGGQNVVNTKAYLSRHEIREIANLAGCHGYLPSGSTLYGDNRFIGVFPSEAVEAELTLKEKGSYINFQTKERFENVDKIPLSLPKNSHAFFLKIEK